METFIKFFESISHRYGFALEITYSSISEWIIRIGYKCTHPNAAETLVFVQDCDVDLAFAKAQVAFKEWLCENNGGY